MSSDKQPPQKWGITAADFAKRAAENRALHQASSSGGTFTGEQIREQRTGRITWRPGTVNFELIRPSEVKRSLFRLEKSLPELIWNAAALEGNTFTLPQVQTLLDGVTVGGKKLEEEQQILALSEGMRLMINAVRDGSFVLSNVGAPDKLSVLAAFSPVPPVLCPHPPPTKLSLPSTTHNWLVMWVALEEALLCCAAHYLIVTSSALLSYAASRCFIF